MANISAEKGEKAPWPRNAVACPVMAVALLVPSGTGKASEQPQPCSSQGKPEDLRACLGYVCFNRS